jgi:hypothetical protein
MSEHRNRQADSLRISVLQAEGRHIDAEWERLKINGAQSDASEEGLASHRVSFFLGALSIWQAIQEADDETVVDQLRGELEGFLAEMESLGYSKLSASATAGGEWRPRRSIH